MLKFNNFESIASIQASVFYADDNYTTSKYVRKIYQYFDDIFDGEPSIIPLPDGAPQDIPRITVRTKDNGKVLEISPIKINFFINKRADDDLLSLEQFKLAAEYLKKLVLSDATRCNRLAALVKRYTLSEKAGYTIASHFCKDSFLEKPFNRPNEFHLYSHKTYNFLERYDVNSWVKVLNGFVIPHGKKEPAVIVEQDINTLAQHAEINYSDNDIDFFYDSVGQEFDNILKLYFPGQ